MNVLRGSDVCRNSAHKTCKLNRGSRRRRVALTQAERRGARARVVERLAIGDDGGVGGTGLAEHRGDLRGAEEPCRVPRRVGVGGLEEVEVLVTADGDALEDDERARDEREVLGHGEGELEEDLVELARDRRELRALRLDRAVTAGRALASWLGLGLGLGARVRFRVRVRVRVS